MSKTRVLLTGASGFIGRNIREQLDDKYELLCPSSHDLNLLDSAVVSEYLASKQPDLVVHVAGKGVSRGQPLTADIAENNLRMFFNLVRNKKHFQRLIVIGSGAEYDKSRSISQVTEADFDRSVPQDQYGFSKYVMSKYAEQVDYITHLRLFGVYGKYEDYTIRFISNMIARALNDLPLVINQNANFDYIFIDDLVRIIDLMIMAKPVQTFYNLGGDQAVELLQVAQLVNEQLNKRLPIEIKISGLNKEYTCSSDRFKQEYPNFKFTDLKVAIQKLTYYYQNNNETIDPDKLRTN